jgi:membrane protein
MVIAKKLRDLRAFLVRLASNPGGELGRGAGLVHYQIKLWTYCLRRLRDNNAMAMSAALSFRTIFAMVPSLVLVILMLSSLGQKERAEKYLHDYINRSGFTAIQVSARPAGATGAADGESEQAPAPGAATASAPASAPGGDVLSVQDKLNEVIQLVEKKVTFGRLGPIGLALLIWTALTLMTTVERSLNRIFRAPAGRSLGRRTLLYWSALTLGPIALIAALAAGEYVSRYANELIGGHYWLKWLLIPLGLLQPIIVGIILFAGAYALIPNTKVRLRAALTGAVVAFPGWLVAMWGFGLYVTHVVGRDPLYGSLGLLPLFLFWLNTSWLVFLFGAEIAHTSGELAQSGMQLDDEQSAPRDAMVSPWDMLAAALAVAGPYAAGQGPVSQSDIVARLRIKPRSVRLLLEDLVERKLICPVEQADTDGYVPGRPIEQIRVEDVIELADPRDEAQAIKARPYEKDLAKAINQARQTARKALGETTLADLLKVVDGSR